MDTQKQIKQCTRKLANFSISRAKCKLTAMLSETVISRKKNKKSSKSGMDSAPYQTIDSNNNTKTVNVKTYHRERVPLTGEDQQRKIRPPSVISPCSLSFYGIVFSFVLIAIVQENHAFQLDGSTNSFAQFRKWYTSLNGSLELEFKTEQPNGLVLYTDDGGTYDFFELKLVEGALRLRYNLGGGAQIITVGRDLHDGHWHKVQVCCYCFF